MKKKLDCWGNITANTYIPTVSGYYTLDWVVYNGSNIGALLPKLSVDGGTALALNSSNFNIYSSLAVLDSLNATHGSLVTVSDGGYYPVSPNYGIEDSTIKLSNVTVSVADIDSESIVSLALHRDYKTAQCCQMACMCLLLQQRPLQYHGMEFKCLVDDTTAQFQWHL